MTTLLLATALLLPAAFAESQSHTRVAYVVGRPFLNHHDRFGTCDGFSQTVAPRILGHEAISVGLGCSDKVRVSAVMSALSWISDHGETDATVVMSRDHRGHEAVERALQGLRDKGVTVPRHQAASRARTRLLPFAAMGGAIAAAFACAALLLIRHRPVANKEQLRRSRSRSVPLPTERVRAAQLVSPSYRRFSVDVAHKQSWKSNSALHGALDVLSALPRRSSGDSGRVLLPLFREAANAASSGA